MLLKKSLSKIAGINLRKIIIKKNLTQEAAANLLNIEERTLRRWLKDGINKISTLELITRVFELESITTLLILK